MINLLKILKLLTKKQINRSIFILILMIISAIMEVAGLGLIIPTIYLMAEPNYLNNYPFILDTVNNIFSIIGLETISKFSFSEVIIVFLILLITILFFLKNILLVFLQWFQVNYVSKLSSEWQNILYSGYLKNSYNFYFNNSASKLLHNINQSSVLSTGINSFLIIVTDSILIISLILFLIFLQPVETILTFIIFAISCVILYSLIKGKIETIGKKSHYYEGQRQSLTLDSFSGIREIKLNNKEDMFSEIFRKVNWLALKMGIYKAVISAIPRFWLETTFLICLNIIVIVIFYTSDSILNSLQIIAVFAAAAFRIMPSSGRIMVNLNILKTNLPVSQIVQDEINNLENVKYKSVEKIDFENKITIKDLKFKYEKDQSNVLENINLEIKKKSIIGITGVSGSGKSTFLDLFIGLIIPDSGEILADNKNIKSNIKGWQNKIGYVSQEVFLINDSFAKNISYEMDEKNIDYKKINELIKILNLDKFINNLENKIHSNVGERGIKISGGQMKRISIARALYKNPSILILDETLSSLDTETETKIMSEIKSIDQNLTIIIVSHRPGTLDLCDEVYRINNGNLNFNIK